MAMASLLLTACASTGDTASTGGATVSTGEPAPFAAAMERESTVKKEQLIKLGDRHTMTLIGTIDDPPEYNEENDYWYFSSTYGGEGFVECLLLQNDWYPLTAMNRVALTPLEDVEAEGYEVVSRNLVLSGVEVVDDFPTGVVSYAYQTRTAGADPLLNLITARVAYQNESSLVCINNVVGYQKTFQRIFMRLATSWQQTEQLSNPYFEELILMSLEDKPVGFIKVVMELDEDGDTRVLTEDSVMIQVDDATLSIDEGKTIEYSRPDGALINTIAMGLSNDVIEHELTLRRGSVGGPWEVRGELQGKQVSYDLDAAEVPLSYLGEQLVTRGALQDPSVSRFVLRKWVGNLDPSRIIDVAGTVNSRAPDANQVGMTIGPMVINATLQDDGSLIKGTTSVANINLTLQQVYSKGTW